VAAGQHGEPDRQQRHADERRQPRHGIQERPQPRGHDQSRDEEHGAEGRAEHDPDHEPLAEAGGDPAGSGGLVARTEVQRQEARQHREAARVHRGQQPGGEREGQRGTHETPALRKAAFSVARSVGAASR
jgi:hypothetical protein